MPRSVALRRDESLLLVALVALLTAAVAALLVLPGAPGRRIFAPEAGSLLAPPSDQSLTQGVAAPAAPADAILAQAAGTSNGNGSAGGAGNEPHGKPAPQPGPTTQPTPPNNGLIHFIAQLLPPPPPPPRRASIAAMRASFHSALVRGLL